MKRGVYFLVLVVILVSCGQSQEEKANKLIKSELNKVLFKPESYKPVETKVDSAFAPLDDPALFALLKEYKKIELEMDFLHDKSKHIQRSMAIYDGPYQSAYDKVRYNDSKEEYNQILGKISRLKEKGHDTYFEILKALDSHERFIGYLVSHNYRADNNAGNTIIGNDLFIIDPEFKEVIYQCSVADYNYHMQILKEFMDSYKEKGGMWE